MSDSATPWTVACQAPLSMGFSRQECWSGLPCPPPGDLPKPGIEPLSLTSLALADRFNSKKAGNCDWQFNVLVGLNIKLGKSYKKTAPVYYEPEPVVEQPKPQPVVKQPEPEPVAVVVEPMKQNIFFALNSALLQKDQQSKIDAMVAYMEKYPASKVAITGYADKETGNPRINMTLSEKRAKIVADALKAKGIAADRIVTDFKGDTVQPFRVPEENRVSVCIAE